MQQSQNKFTKALDKLNSTPIDINDLPKARNGNKCDCICVECKQPLEACQGLVNSWYFRHVTKTNCKGGPMTALHLLAQHLLKGNQEINTANGIVQYKGGLIEFNIPTTGFRADIAGIKDDDYDFIIEILVTHSLDLSKTTFLKNSKIHSIEIDLRDVDPNIRSNELLDILLNDVSKQRVIYCPSHQNTAVDFETTNKSRGNKPWYDGLIPLAIIATGIIMLRSFLKKSNRRRKRL